MSRSLVVVVHCRKRATAAKQKTEAEDKTGLSSQTLHALRGVDLETIEHFSCKVSRLTSAYVISPNICSYNQRQKLKAGKAMTDELKIEDLVLGEGKAAERGALITAHYRGWLEDGTEFDSSHKRGEAFQCILSNNRVIQGWILGLKGMQVGGKRKLWVPAHLAYGERQIGTMIPPHSNLIFEIELLEVLTRD
jgi:peptidylprolyl isomerase